jgi:hypothetical protein
MNRSLVAVLVLTLAATAAAQEHAPRVSPVALASDGAAATFSIRWPNGWRNERNHDGAWIVLRGPDATRPPLHVAASGHRATSGTRATVTASADGLGVLVAPAAAHRGEFACDVEVRLAAPGAGPVTAWAVGMVLVPAGGFELGDDEPVVVRHGAFHRVGDDGEPAGPFAVTSEGELRVAKAPGALWYVRDRNGYQGDQGGPIPAAWPKGTRAFWVMKHELTQGEYAAWLSALPPAWRDARAPLAGRGEEADTCSLARDHERIVARAPDRPCNFVSWDDTCAWADWMALRPMTELEFEKAARGPKRPVAGDYPWGTAALAPMQRRVQRTRDLAHATVADEAKLDDASRERLGASFFWVMDLSGSVWERVVSAAHPAGRAFTGTHGDGVLAPDGKATNADWPKTRADGEEADGLGFRGGAEYFAPGKPDDPTNPCSRTATRTYAGWGGANRYKTYSARAVRTADS